MSAATAGYQRTFNPLPLILLAVLSTAVGAILLGVHATKRHSEAQQIRDCLAEQGAKQTWQQDNDPSVFCFVVEMEPCASWAVLIAQVWPSIVDGCEWRERTSFQPGDGTPEKVIRYLEKAFTRID